MNSDIPECVTLESCACPLGCESNDTQVLSGRDLLHGLPGKYSVVRCQSCGLQRTNPRPTAGTIGFYYPDDYGPYEGSKIKEDSGSPSGSSFWRVFLDHLKGKGSTPLPDQSPGYLLEVGCASGSFLHKMHNKGWQTYGIEFSEEAANNARRSGLEVFAGSIDTAPMPETRYDLVVAWMVLEHLHDPIAALRRIHAWTNSDGWLVFSVPNIDSWSFKLFQKNWHALQLPTHLFHFDIAVLRKVLYEAGWDFHSVHHQQNFSSPVASLGYWLQGKGMFKRLAASMVRFPTAGSRWAYRCSIPFAFVEKLLRQSSRITVWARPRSEL